MKSINLLLVLVLFAIRSNAQVSPVFAPGGKAIHGYDPVAFFNESKPVMGSDSLAFMWNKVTWLFASQQDKELFMAAPEKYAPQYGGYCAYGTSQGHKAPTEVETWSVINGKLYFNYNSDVKKLWTKDPQAFIEKADKLWPEIRDKK